ncbi:MAG TPA: 23S rRNA (pseudouridine(1915)-N(3))-methyltransferase RlmH [bacterium]|jgi:23S rRNA (pseudouridine1915-N3)-methyltransferase|nr:23S rRNA (pseudouridine(1915)-N(3))-methyltransferase RlmH [bacterium]HOG38468.1 23S rRNA (pseudouridine(1915)-N(3))-methyltransferase RlmH [bacterium]
MFDIKIITIGKIKEKWIERGILEYIKRLSPYAKIEIIELKSESFSSSNKQKAVAIESARLEEALFKEKDSTIYFLDEYGDSLGSREFAYKLDKENGKIVFVIAGALGYNREILKNKNLISLSKLTFTHTMARLILLEQIYRSVCILKDKEYHY